MAEPLHLGVNDVPSIKGILGFGFQVRLVFFKFIKTSENQSNNYQIDF